jgi:nucleotide-binding universal stress UspA family protein
MYDAASRLGDRIFGSLPDRIANETGDPVIVVRRDYEPQVRDAD